MKELEHLHPSNIEECRLAHPNFPHTFLPQLSKNSKSNCFKCGKQVSTSLWRFHYHCNICGVDFQNGCHSLPRKIIHPFHLQHPLFLTFKNNGIINDGSNVDPCRSRRLLDPPGKSVFDTCTWCTSSIPKPNLIMQRRICFYRCSICSFCLDMDCAKIIPPLTLQNPKSHHHSLVLFTRPLLVPCDACGLVNASEPSYACFQCNYMVHQSCVDLPHVIKITRHHHRLSYSPYLPPSNSLCRVCYKPVDIKYGQYSCKEEDCSYILHSKCATRKEIWDGKELEWEPEEFGVTEEDIAPFKKVGDDLIQHFSHEQHNLKLEKYNSIRHENKLCQACVFPINLQDFYNCVECDFVLHQVCANLPRKVDHALHVHSLFIDPSPQLDVYKLKCSACSRISTGFQYKCSDQNCEIDSFKIDIRCFLVPEYGINKVHEHPLFIVLTKTYNPVEMVEFFRCHGCKRDLHLKYRLQCTSCEFFSVCYKCITIPNELHYKHDKHPLFLCYGEDTDNKYWCEECEEEVDPSEWFYTCNKCCVTIHRDCVFAFSVYLKPGYTFKYYNRETLEVLSNDSSTRPICRWCKDRCRGSTYFKINRKTFCYCCLLQLRQSVFSILV